MANVKIDKFCGICPRLHPTMLADGMAVRAHNCRLKNGKIVPIKDPLKVAESMISLENGLKRIADAKTIYPWKRRVNGVTELQFLAFPGIVDIAVGNIADDEYNRLFVTGETGISFTDPYTGKVHENVPCVYLKQNGSDTIIRHCLVKAPLAPPLIANDNGNHDPDSTRYTRFFQTWVDKYGYESGVSEPSWAHVLNAGGEGVHKWLLTDTEYNDGDTVQIEALSSSVYADNNIPTFIPPGSVNPDGTFNPQSGCKRRIYKVITGEQTESVRFLKEISENPWRGDAIRVKDEDSGEVLTEVTAIPKDLHNMVHVPGNFYVGFSPSSSKTVMFSEVNIPYSWPIDYRYDIRDNIVGIAVTSNSVFVLTDGYPWVISGTSPESMVASVLAGPAACVSKRSICTYRNSVFYASHQGVCTIFNDADSGTVVQNLTDKFFTKEQWQALNPSTCLMRQYDGALHCFFKTANGPVGLTIDLTESECSITTHSEEATSVCVDDETDTLYFVREGV